LILATPQKLGAYSLEIGLVRLVDGRADWIVTTPRAPLRFNVQVDPPTSSGIAAWLPDGSAAGLRGSKEGDRFPPLVVATLDAARFEAGSPIALELEVASPWGSPVRDLYAGVLMPDRRTALFFRRDRTLTTVFLANHRQFVPLATMDPGFSLRAPSFFQGTIPVGAPAGLYELFVIVTTQGALRKPHPSANDIVLLQTTTFEVLP
jgi:hypothetical protein